MVIMLDKEGQAMKCFKEGGLSELARKFKYLMMISITLRLRLRVRHGTGPIQNTVRTNIIIFYLHRITYYYISYHIDL